ncbi:glucose-1-phosphate adenylyltransferase [Rhodoferax koreense]|uniref:Glucose-1-phosphate adenylyltransferase n=1 Tax=Rhodoferax koreensis TaxID=1842727 RepID=A0A1P8JWL5_9BURK|nr:glucose-1-phosphate adenylyltransferase [Rhodoferax koreense]
MAHHTNVLSFVMAGGEGSRLRPLTANNCKPAVPFGSGHRIVDFVLSNLVNSNVLANYLLVQYKSQSLEAHVQRVWQAGGQVPKRCVTVVPPRSGQVFQGTADAVYQNIDLIRRHKPDVVAVFGADHIYRMDVQQMIDFHQRSGADATVAALPVRLDECHQFGIVETDGEQRITDFREKPKTSSPMPGSTSHALASMGNYIFNADVLLAALERAAGTGATDFGKDILPAMVRTHHLAAYDFTTNEIPGVAGFEELGYWRDVGTIDAYFEAHLDTLGAQPRFSMANPHWPIHGADPTAAETAQCHAMQSVVGTGCSLADGASLERSVLRSGVVVERGAQLERCIVMDRARIGSGARLRGVIVDQDNEVPANECIGFDAERDRQRFQVTDSGVVVVPAGFFAPRPVVVQPARNLLPSLPFLRPKRGTAGEGVGGLGMAV